MYYYRIPINTNTFHINIPTICYNIRFVRMFNKFVASVHIIGIIPIYTYIAHFNFLTK